MKRNIISLFVMLSAAGLAGENVISNVRENVVNIQDSGSSVNSGISLGDKSSESGMIKGNGERASVKREIASFDSISVSGAFIVNIEITSGTKMELEITSDSNIADCIGTDVENGILTISTSKSYSSENPVSFNIKLSSLKNIACGGACKVTISGKTENLSVELRGASKLSALGLDAANLVIEAGGASHAEVSASKSLTVNGSGAAKVLYKGTASKITKELSGASSLVNME